MNRPHTSPAGSWASKAARSASLSRIRSSTCGEECTPREPIPTIASSTCAAAASTSPMLDSARSVATAVADSSTAGAYRVRGVAPRREASTRSTDSPESNWSRALCPPTSGSTCGVGRSERVSSWATTCWTVRPHETPMLRTDAARSAITEAPSRATDSIAVARGAETTCASRSENAARSAASSTSSRRGGPSGSWIVISTIPRSRAWVRILETFERDSPSSCATSVCDLPCS